MVFLPPEVEVWLEVEEGARVPGKVHVRCLLPWSPFLYLLQQGLGRQIVLCTAPPPGIAPHVVNAERVRV